MHTNRKPSRRIPLLERMEPRAYLAAHILGNATVYQTIQAAVNAASPGATINIDAGNYAELVTISKPLTLQGAQAGKDAQNRGGAESVITGVKGSSGISSAFYITTNDV